MITNNLVSGAALAKLSCECVLLYQPADEWTYSHHPHIAWFGTRLYATWSNGRVDEDAPGQRVLLADAEAFQAWSEPRALLGPVWGTHSEVVLTAGGFHSHAGVLVAYIGQYEYTSEGLRRADSHRPPHEGTCLLAVTTSDGQSWSTVRDLGVPVVPNHGPQRTRSGRLIISGNISYPYTDDPSGLSGWTMSGIYPPDMADSVYDDPDGFWHVRQRMGWPAGLCEGAFFQTADGTLHMLLRATGEGHAGRLWLTQSTDDGTSWSRPVRTDFTDNDTKFHFGRLPDGRYYYVGCPDPEPRGARRRLILSLSEDGARFDHHRILVDEDYMQRASGRWKEGLYGYPHTIVYDGWLYAIVSLRKEAVAVYRVRCSDL